MFFLSQRWFYSLCIIICCQINCLSVILINLDHILLIMAQCVEETQFEIKPNTKGYRIHWLLQAISENRFASQFGFLMYKVLGKISLARKCILNTFMIAVIGVTIIHSFNTLWYVAVLISNYLSVISRAWFLSHKMTSHAV